MFFIIKQRNITKPLKQRSLKAIIIQETVVYVELGQDNESHYNTRDSRLR